MNKLLLILTLLLVSSILKGDNNDTQKNAFSNFNEFLLNEPSLTFNFELKKRTDSDIFMWGGIKNYRVKNVTPKSEKYKLEEEIWGIIEKNVVYINSYPYSKIKGYNEIIEKGYYSYFIGEPARTRKEQRELGFIELKEKKLSVYGMTGYVILPDGTVKHLSPGLLLELCKDNEELTRNMRFANLKVEDVETMFYYLSEYNKWKNKE